MILIDKDSIKFTKFEMAMCGGDFQKAFKLLCEKLDDAPIVDAVPVRHGHWSNIKISVTGNSSAECSLCGTVVHDTFADVNRINYCPQCGAKMDEVSEYV